MTAGIRGNFFSFASIRQGKMMQEVYFDFSSFLLWSLMEINVSTGAQRIKIIREHSSTFCHLDYAQYKKTRLFSLSRAFEPNDQMGKISFIHVSSCTNFSIKMNHFLECSMIHQTQESSFNQFDLSANLKHRSKETKQHNYSSDGLLSF